MKVVNNPNIVCFDVDDTLVLWDALPEEKTVYIENKHFATNVKPHARHIEAIKESKLRGHYVIVWSQGGHEWAQDVAKALQLEQYVDLIMTKPKWAYDDLPIEQWLTRLYKDKS